MKAFRKRERKLFSKFKENKSETFPQHRSVVKKKSKAVWDTWPAITAALCPGNGSECGRVSEVYDLQLTQPFR